MDAFLVLRRGPRMDAAGLLGAELRARPAAAGAPAPPRPRWRRSLLVRSASGEAVAACVYEATSAEAVREHLLHCGLPADVVMPLDAARRQGLGLALPPAA
ncbi:MAG: DUF4242 domain-containing protein [Pseudomonadota bacterium]|jgi:hypothetical protein|nr:MAG: hypothetical protein DIU62_13090 [Pseudomonadota bacterium]